MNLPESKRKKYYSPSGSNLPFPIIFKKDGTLKKFSAIFNGHSVVIKNPEDMKTLISMGNFGKSSLSRNYPQTLGSQKTKFLRQRQFANKQTCINKINNKVTLHKVIVIPDSDSDNDDYFNNLQPKYEADYLPISETVMLGYEEAFFLENVVKCIEVSYKDNKLTSEELWNLFLKVDPYFIQNYVVYYFYRSKNWVVKPGIKFGGDFIIYQEGPAFYHATYIVIIQTMSDEKHSQSLKDGFSSTTSLLGLNRLCETAGKGLLFCNITWPEASEISYTDLSNIKINEVFVKRWNYSQENIKE
ncbi:tRNA-splicing endonuclease subunit Sen2 [Anthonomus grandis grandis]|uniref:tRNA-splicing endonuclease subunit Sen2 n=1 Tax=Anthonomus grandis grandis TaxID=2921223 RepID=UPI0021664FFF|nr:tRNA-splicing endonuclease subunit Sen2 [Anthonomus grandis grandis]